MHSDPDEHRDHDQPWRRENRPPHHSRARGRPRAREVPSRSPEARQASRRRRGPEPPERLSLRLPRESLSCEGFDVGFPMSVDVSTCMSRTARPRPQRRAKLRHQNGHQHRANEGEGQRDQRPTSRIVDRVDEPDGDPDQGTAQRHQRRPCPAGEQTDDRRERSDERDTRQRLNPQAMIRTECIGRDQPDPHTDHRRRFPRGTTDSSARWRRHPIALPAEGLVVSPLS